MDEAVVRDHHILPRVPAVLHGHGEGKARHALGLPRPQQRLVLRLIEEGGGVVRRVPVLQTEERSIALYTRQTGGVVQC
jgi:hypothetical protein